MSTTLWVWYRYLTYRISWVCGRIPALIRGKGRTLVFVAMTLTGTLTLGLWLVAPLLQEISTPKLAEPIQPLKSLLQWINFQWIEEKLIQPLSPILQWINNFQWIQWIKTLSLYLLLALLFVLSMVWIWRTGKRLVVEEFVNHVGDHGEPVTVGLATLLVVELARLNELYHNVNEQRATPMESKNEKTSAASGRATIKVGEDIGDFLGNAVSTDSAFTIGPVKIPANILIALFGHLLRGPRIAGSLHKDKDVLIVTAQMFDKGEFYSWRVDSSTPLVWQAEESPRGLDEMISELACIIFTDLTRSGPTGWKAAWAFKEGLREYRDCLYTRKDENLRLERAEMRFMQALHEDKNFDLAYYNLGVVYTELKRPEAAERAFLKAVWRNPERWRAYYALGLIYYQHGSHEAANYESAIRMFDQVIKLKPRKASIAEAYKQKGLSQRRLSERLLTQPPNAPEHVQEIIKKTVMEKLSEAIQSCEKAVSYSWKALLWATLKGSGANEKKIASDCLSNLAAAYSDRAIRSTGRKRKRALTRAKALFKQALFLTRCDAELRFELGKIYVECAQRKKAARQYETAARINPDRAEFWAYFDAAREDNGSVGDAWHRFLDFVYGVPKELLEQIKEQYELFGKTKRILRINKLRWLMVRLEEANGQNAGRVLEKMLGQYDGKDREWEYAQVALHLGRWHGTNQEPGEATKYVKEAIEKIHSKYPRQISGEGLRAQLAALLNSGGQTREALRQARSALWLNPLNYHERDTLGQIYRTTREWEQARGAWEYALLWKPNMPTVHLNLGIIGVNMALDLRDPARRNAELRKAVRWFEQARHLYVLHEEDKSQGKGQVNHWLGKLYYELGEYDKAISHLKISQNMSFSPLMTALLLGSSYQKNKRYNESAQQFRRVIKEAKKRKRDKVSLDEVDKGESVGWPLGEMLAKAYAGLTCCNVERAGFDGIGWEEPLRDIIRAYSYVTKLEELGNEDASTRARAFCLACYGWLRYNSGEVDEAIEHLKRAVSLNAGAETYLHLALAHEHKLQKCGEDDEDEFRALAKQVREYCRYVEGMDLKKEYEQRVAELLQRLDQEEKSREEGSKLKVLGPWAERFNGGFARDSSPGS